MRSTEQAVGWRALVALVVLATVVFGPPLWSAGLLNFDDNLFFGPDNPAFQSAYDGQLGLLIDPSHTIANAYLPVSHLSLFADYVWMRWLDAGPRMAHLHSLLLHVLAAFVLARLLVRLGFSRGAALVGAMVFAVHPALSESVAWLSSRKDLLSGLLSFLCLSAVIDDARQPRWRGLVWAGGFALLAMYAKGTSVVLALLAPFVVAVFSERRPGRFRAALVVVAIALAVTAHHVAIASAEGTMAGGSPLSRWTQAPGAYLHYLRVLVWPTGLNVLYPEVKTLEVFRGDAALGVLAVAVVLLAGLIAFRRGAVRVAAGLWMTLLALLPFNTVWPASAIAAADRYLYLVVPWAAMALVALGRWGPWLAALLVLPFGWCAAERARDFQTSEQLWRSSLSQDSENAVARINLAAVLAVREPRQARALVERAVADARYPQHQWRAEQFLRDLAWQQGRPEEACLHARRAADAADELPPSDAARGARVTASLAAASMMRMRGDDRGAAVMLERARKIAPDHPGVLAYAAEAMRLDASDPPSDADWQRARPLLERALAVDPDHFDAHLSMARWCMVRGEFMAALRHYRAARATAPARPETYLGECDLYLGAGDFVGAESAARAGIAAGSDDTNLLLRLGVSMTGQGRLDDARTTYESYLALRPTDSTVRRSLAAVIAAEAMQGLYQRDSQELERVAARLLELDPDNPKGLLIRGLSQRLQRHFAAALVLFERAHEAMPGDPDARRLLAETNRDRGYELLGAGETEAALDAFRRFVDLGVAEVDVASATSILRTHWQRHEKLGEAAFTAGEFAAAEAEFRRCLELVPEQVSACFQLGLAVLSQEDGRAHEALALFERAATPADQISDVSLAVLYQVLTLQRLGRDDEAVDCAERYLERVVVARPAVLARIRAAVGKH